MNLATDILLGSKMEEKVQITESLSKGIELTCENLRFPIRQTQGLCPQILLDYPTS